jgi:hypothetical protein
LEKTYSNVPEDDFAALARENGWRPTKRGWPDFLCFGPNGEIIAVEVKPRLRDGRRTKRLKADQANCMDALSAVGIRCFVSDGKTLEPYDRELHRDRNGRRS